MSVDQENWADFLWDVFEFSYEEHANDIARLESLQDTYDNKVDEDLWSTQSQIPLPLAWAAVEEATGPALDYLLPSQPFARLIPADKMDQETLDRVQWALHLMLMHRMRIKRNVSRSIRDCFKVSVGYGIVEPIIVTPPTVREVVAGRNRTKQMAIGKASTSLRYRYISPGKVIVYPSGVDFNGDDATPFAFFLELYPEHQFRKMYEDQPRDGEDVALKGDPEEIIAEARSRGFDSVSGYIAFMERMSGRESYARGVQRRDHKAPGVVPILKCYSDNRHTWIFPGASEKKIVFDREQTFDTYRKPLIKFDAWLDADRWYPMSQPEADERITWSKNILFNALHDLITQNVKRPIIYNTDMTDQPPHFGPGGPVGMAGDVRQAAQYLDPPTLDAGLFNMMDQIDAMHNNVTGQRDFTQRNFTRGGSMAFQDLLQSSTGRERLRHALLQTGGFESLIYQTLIYMQTLGAGIDLNFQRPAFRQDTGQDYYEYFSVTEDDLRHSFELMLDLDAKHRLGSMDQQMKLQLYQMKRDNPYIDQYEAIEDLFTDEYTLNRQRKPRDVVRQEEEQRNAAQLEAMRSQGAPAGAAAPPAVAGALEGGIA